VVGDKHRVYYRAKVRITVRTPGGGKVVREGCGYGSGIDKDLGQAHESALKEAESDAEKRALKTFGNPFGQALYDKTKANVTDEPPAPAEPSMAVNAAKLAIEMCGSSQELAGWLAEHKDTLNRLNDADYAAVGEIIKAKKADLKLKVAA
jgi:recombination DNA repair RAD52 pathway protein